MTGSKISNNAAGAIYASGATVTIRSTDFYNSGRSASSALYFNNSTVELSGVTVQGCSGRISPVLIQDSDVTVSGFRIIGNTSNTGVGIFIENNSDHTVTMKDNTVISENAGTGIYAYSANGHLALNLEGVTIRDNTATDNRSGGSNRLCHRFWSSHPRSRRRNDKGKRYIRCMLRYHRIRIQYQHPRGRAVRGLRHRWDQPGL